MHRAGPHAPSPPPAPPRPVPHPRVLVVLRDDELGLALPLLAERGCVPCGTADPSLARALLAHCRYDVLLVDSRLVDATLADATRGPRDPARPRPGIVLVADPSRAPMSIGATTIERPLREDGLVAAVMASAAAAAALARTLPTLDELSAVG